MAFRPTHTIPLAVGAGSSQDHATPSGFVLSHQHLGRSSNATSYSLDFWPSLRDLRALLFEISVCIGHGTPRSNLLSPLLLSWPSIATLHFR